MSPATRDATWDRIRRFAFDEPGAHLSFTARLARENGWTPRHALRVVDEYRKFMFLAVTAGHVVTPSADVDHAWHLHLAYTRSYWQRFCGACLGREVHHDPTTGGPDEQAKYIALYEQTLTSYCAAFGQPPPADVWPDAAQRFGQDVFGRWVNTKRNWIVRRPAFLRGPNGRRSRWAAAAILPIVDVTWNPFDLDGPRFLVLYGALALVALIASIVARRMRQLERSEYEVELGPYEVAVLSQGESLATSAALSNLVQRGVLELEEKELTRRGELESSAPPLEHALVAAVEAEGALGLRAALAGGSSETAAIRASLENQGLLETSASFASTRRLVASFLGFVLAIGVTKILVGVSRERPVLFLVLACAATLFALVALARRPHRTRRGDRTLARLRGRYPAPMAGRTADAIPGPDLAWCVGLWGATVLAGSDVEPIAHAARRTASPSGHAGDASGCGGDAGGGCGSGCGGGGCGGCGG